MKDLNQTSKPVTIIFHLIFIVGSLICLFPLLIVLSVSLSSESSITMNGYQLIPQKVSFLAYSFLLNDFNNIARAYMVTIIVSVTGTMTSLVMTSLYAYPLFLKSFPFRKFFSFYIFITMIFNGGLVPFYILYTRYLGLNNRLLALILPYLVNAFYVIIMRTFFTSTIPEALIDAAKIDGAKDVFILFRVVVPISLPVYAVIGLFTLLTYWNDWFMSLLFIRDQSKVSIQYFMYKVILNLRYLMENTNVPDSTIPASELPGESARMAMAVIGIGPIIFAYPFFQKYFVQGLTIGAVKG